MMILAIVVFWEVGQEALYIPEYYKLTMILANILKACHWSVTFIMVLKNPGVVSCDKMTIMPDVDSDMAFKKIRPCEPCMIISAKTEHCERCDVCFEGVDHHCPWMNKCVAKGNLTEFYLFLALTFGSLFYALGITIFMIN